MRQIPTIRLRYFIPSQIRKPLRLILEFCHAELLLHSRNYCQWFVRREMSSFRQGKGSEYTWNGSEGLRVGAFWDNDGRFRWLERVARHRNVGLLHIPRSIYRPVFRHLLQRNGYGTNIALGEVSLQTFYHERFQAYRDAYQRYCMDVAKILGDIYKFDVILLPKLADDWIIDVIHGFRKSGYPVVVNDREHGVTSKRMEIWPKHFEAVIDDLLVERLCMSNEIQMEFFKRCKFPPDRMILTGKPDSDYWKHSGPPMQPQKIHHLLREDRTIMVFYAFGKLNYLNHYYAGEKRDWTTLGEDYHEILLELLRRHKDRLQIVYKIGGKPARDSYPLFDKFAAEARLIAGEEALVVLDGSYSTLDLLRVSNLVVGFQTFALIEAMFTKQPIFYGAWGGLFSDIKETLLPLHRSQGLTFLDSKDALLTACDQFIQAPSQWILGRDAENARKETTQKWLYKPDGRSSERLMDVIEDVAVEYWGNHR
jgi:hypothetical protein